MAASENRTVAPRAEVGEPGAARWPSPTNASREDMYTCMVVLNSCQQKQLCYIAKWSIKVSLSCLLYFDSRKKLATKH